MIIGYDEYGNPIDDGVSSVFVDQNQGPYDPNYGQYDYGDNGYAGPGGDPNWAQNNDSNTAGGSDDPETWNLGPDNYYDENEGGSNDPNTWGSDWGNGIGETGTPFDESGGSNDPSIWGTAAGGSGSAPAGSGGGGGSYGGGGGGSTGGGVGTGGAVNIPTKGSGSSSSNTSNPITSAINGVMSLLSKIIPSKSVGGSGSAAGATNKGGSNQGVAGTIGSVVQNPTYMVVIFFVVALILFFIYNRPKAVAQ